MAVLVAGVEDPKWPLGSGRPRIMSPFDESALEVALELRDAEPATRISVYVAGDEAFARTVAAYRPDRLSRIDVPSALEWDACAQAAMWRAILAGAGHGLILLGREFGDRDDGAFPACLAEAMQWPYLALIQEARVSDAGLELVRERGNIEERFSPRRPVLASITNDRRNKLRHPLMKNVMAAKRAAIDAIQVPGAAQSQVFVQAIEPSRTATRTRACRLLDGPVEARIAELARFLEPWRRAA